MYLKLNLTCQKVKINATEGLWLIIQMFHGILSNREFQYYGTKIIFMMNEEANFSKHSVKYRHIHFRQGFPVALTKYVNLIY